MSSSLLPLNMLPVMTSIQPWCGSFLITSIQALSRWLLPRERRPAHQPDVAGCDRFAREKTRAIGRIVDAHADRLGARRGRRPIQPRHFAPSAESFAKR